MLRKFCNPSALKKKLLSRDCQPVRPSVHKPLHVICLPSSQASISSRSIVLGHAVRDEKCGLGKNPKIETICLNFSPSRFHLAKGYSLSISGRVTAIEKQFNAFAFCLMLTGQVCRLSYALKFSSFFLIRSG